MANFVQSFTYEDIFDNSDGIILHLLFRRDRFALRTKDLHGEIMQTKNYGFMFYRILKARLSFLARWIRSAYYRTCYWRGAEYDQVVTGRFGTPDRFSAKG